MSARGSLNLCDSVDEDDFVLCKNKKQAKTFIDLRNKQPLRVNNIMKEKSTD